jgi:endonuclease-3
VEDGLLARVPAEMLKPAHLWLILHGRYVCKARAPECWRCVAIAPCRYPAKTLAPPTTKPPTAKPPTAKPARAKRARQEAP